MKTDVENLVKREDGVLEFTDKGARSSYLTRRKALESQAASNEDLNRRINSLTTEMSEIKALLMTLINKDK